MAAKTLALISGKGGSGKTTIGICIATMLADCKQKTLLVDCDLSTNGATYFYEERINESNQQIISFMDLIEYVDYEDHFKYKAIKESENGVKELIEHDLNNNPDEAFFRVNDYLLFTPSFLPKDLKTRRLFTRSIRPNGDKFKNLFKSIINHYDFVIFDCQAGYSEALELILTVSDYTLLVMEADAISSAAVRNLYMKIAPRVEYSKVYQVFSKVTSEEKNIYENIVSGTFYTSIGAVEFDWNVRRAFAIAQIPDFLDTESEFGIQIYNICTRLFGSKNITEKLKKYKILFEYNRLVGEMEELKPNGSRAIKFGISIIVLIIAAIMVHVLYMFDVISIDTSFAIIVIMLALMLGIGFTLLTSDAIQDGRDYLITKEKLADFVEKNPNVKDYISRE